MEKFDLCVIGGGPAGYAAAIRSLDFNKKTILIERNKLGGGALFNGALSSKILWEISTEYYLYKQLTESQDTQFLKADFNWIKKIMQKTLSSREKNLIHQLEVMELIHGKNFSYRKGNGSLVDKNTVKITTDKGEEFIQAKYIILATGSRPRMLNGIQVDEKNIFTSDGIHDLKQFPKSIVILGAGVIGCEFATILSNFGKTRVNLIDKEDRILPFEDHDVTDLVINNFEKQGVNIHHGATLDNLELKNGKIIYTLKFKDNSIRVHKVDKCLLSIGRIPNIEGLGLDRLNIKCKSGGHIEDDDTQTSISNIYAVGDLTADIALLNVGELEGRHAVEKIFLKKPQRLSYKNVSTIMFLNPEIATVGMNETQARKAGLSYKVATYHYSYIVRALAMRKTDGFFKILVTDDKEMRILGMRALGMHSSSAIDVVSLLVSLNKGIEELSELIHPHPSIPEGIQECVRMFTGKSIMKPSVFKNGMSCYRVVNGVKMEL